MVQNYENFQKSYYTGCGEYQIPEIRKEQYDGCEWIGFNYAMSVKDRSDRGVHFFLDDYQFIRLWNNIDRYIPVLRQYRYVMTPDFSLYTDYPKALQIYSHYRKHWTGAYMQEKGIRVIPTIGWSTPDSFSWCFDGEPVHSTVAVSSVGTQRNKTSKAMFLMGYDEMINRLEPDSIIFYGPVPEECRGNIIRISAFQEKFKEVSNGRKR